jgi:hypothetical protein
MIQVPGLFTGLDCCSGKEAACEAVCVYREQVTMKPVLQDRPARRGKIVDLLIILALEDICLFE